MAHASVGISIVNLRNGEQVDGIQSDQALTPASTLKLVTTASALRFFSPQQKFPTRVSYTGTISGDGLLNGNLIVYGSADPTLGSEYGLRAQDDFVRRVVAQLAEKGIRKITGSVIAADFKPGLEGISPYWTWEDLGNYYAAGSYLLNYGDNKYELVLDTSRKGQQPRVKETRPEMPALRFTNELLPVSYSFDSAYIHGAPYSNERVITGAVPQKGAEFKIKGDVPDPALFLAQTLTAALRKAAVTVNGVPQTTRLLKRNGKDLPGQGEELFTYQSDPLNHIVRVTNVRSNNMYAESLLRFVALEVGNGSHQQGIAALKRHWQEAGLDTEALFMFDGSGLAPANRVSASFLTSLLFEMRGDEAFVNSIPRVGEEGTVAGFLKGTPFQGKGRLKSGSFKNVLSYAGYLQGKESYAIAILVNNFTGSNSQLRKAITELLLALEL